jgi:hypothetical protein
MKSLSLSFLLAIVTIVASAQTDSIPEKPIIDRTTGKNEIKLNFLYTVIEFYDDSKSLSFHLPEIQYERNLTDQFSAGLSFWTSGTDDLKYLFIPHIRLYFGQKNNNFFMELNAAVLKGLSRNGMGHGMPMPHAERMMIKSLGIGGAIGYKFLIGNGFIMETYLGAGKSIQKGNDYSTRIVYPRAGITMGQRF